MKPTIHTLGALKLSGYKSSSPKDEMRANVIRKIRNKETLFPGVIGFDETVIPQVVNAILAKHDILLLGLRGQAKTRLARQLVNLLDEYIPIVDSGDLNDDPLHPVSYNAKRIIAEYGDETPIRWMHRSERYGEKLATPDVSVADLIGDIDPIKAATERLSYSHEGAIHFGIIPRTNRGIFVINELPDLQPRIQVALFNILQERDVQIRGFNVRLPLDVCMIFTANPEDYTNRGSIITPLKDRIESQIMTHYPRTMEDSISITKQEAWIERVPDGETVMPYFIRQIVEAIAMNARVSEFVDQSSGVSARMTISTMENLISNAERRIIVNGDRTVVPRIIDFAHAITGITGKIELVFEGEQEGAMKVSKALVGRAVRDVFKSYFPDPLQKISKRKNDNRHDKGNDTRNEERDEYASVLEFFQNGNTITLTDTMTFDGYVAELEKVPKLRRLVTKHMKIDEANTHEFAVAMEFVLDGLHQNSKIAKEELDGIIAYKDMVGALFTRPQKGFDEEEEW
jgi:magnesium chelatase subunit I